MPLTAPRLDPTWFASEMDPYAALALAIVSRAVLDARGHCSPARGVPVAVLRADARAWLADEDALRDLVELAGYDARVVLHRVRQMVSPATERTVP